MKSYSSRIGRSVYTFRSAILTCVALAAGGGFGCGSSVPPENAELHSRVRSLLRPFRGSVGIYAEDLSGSKQYAYQADDLFPTASVFKVAVMIELFQRAERIELLLDDRRPIAKVLLNLPASHTTEPASSRRGWISRTPPCSSTAA